VRSISSLVQFKRGDHICLFYYDEASLLDNLVPYLAAGLRRGERCFCVQTSDNIPEILYRLETLGFNTTRETHRGALEFHEIDQFYFAAGGFEPQALIDSLERAIEQAVAGGFSGLRTAGELSWALNSRHGTPAVLCDRVVDYENMVERSFPGKPVIGLCQYAAHLFSPHVLRQVLDAHRIAIEETMISANHSTLTLRSGRFLADIVTDRIQPGEAFHYVVQKRNSPEVLSWGQESTLAEAIYSSEKIMEDLSVGRHASRA